MSEAVLKAVADVIAGIETRFEGQVSDLIKRLDNVDSGVKPEAVAILIDEVKAMYRSLYEEVQAVKLEALNKTNLAEQELRKSINETAENTIAKAHAAETWLADELLSVKSLVETVKQEFESLNNDTLNLSANGLETLTERVDFVESQLHSTIQMSVTDLRNELQEKVASIQLKEGPKGETGAAGKDGADGAGIVLDYWKAGIHREGSVVLHYLGQYFRAKCDTVSEPGVDDTWERLGSAGFRHRGGFDAEKAYEVGDLYVKDFATFACIGNEHVLFAARGPAGPRGEKGLDSTVQGPAGRDGATVVKVHTDEDGFVLEMSDGGMHGVPFPKGVQELFKSPSEYIAIAQLKTLAAQAPDFKSFQAALLDL